VPRAVFCFQCNRHLDDLSVIDGIDGAGELIEGALRFIRERGHTMLEPGKVERLRETRSKLRPENLNGEPITCLRCGALNLPDAPVCVGCGGQLIVPDEDFELLARASGRTNVGRVRQNNEDNISLWGIGGVILALVADGMGGAAAGEEASHLTVEAVQADFLGEARGSEQLQVMSEDDLGDHLREAILNANRTVVEHAQKDSAHKGMGTTSTLALIRGNRVFIAHVGDSRAYLVDKRDKTIVQLTSDHSFVQALVASGHITSEQAKNHPMGHVLYRALGQSLELDVDLYTRTLRAGDRLVMCSDGLTRHLSPEDIAAIVLKTDNPTEATLDLIELTNARGAEDNVSAIVVMIDQAERH
jgi:protein phosphatase